MNDLNGLLNGSPYLGYAYAYPHKLAYRRLDPPVPLHEAWARGSKRGLFLYLHIPFCERRCGYCNLFSTPAPRPDHVREYLSALARQAMRVRMALGPVSVARLAIGGGTPTLLPPADLASLFDLASGQFDVSSNSIPVSVETSPATADADKLHLLHQRGVRRISIGVQSFVEAETRRAGRVQSASCVHEALRRIREAGFAVLNIDLIYGLEEQTVASWLTSLREALRYRPEELYLYPLYIRPLTGLGGRDGRWPDLRLECYRAGRDLLLSEGYVQSSMRMFRRADSPDCEGPAYCCQEDGMVGLGCGARSYTRSLHYASEFAVTAPAIGDILDAFCHKADEAHDVAEHGIRLDDEEQRRRWIIKTLLRADGLSLAAYRARFGANALDDVPQLAQLHEAGLAARTDGQFHLTAAGLERSDAIGPWLYSPRVRERLMMASHQ